MHLKVLILIALLYVFGPLAGQEFRFQVPDRVQALIDEDFARIAEGSYSLRMNDDVWGPSAGLSGNGSSLPWILNHYLSREELADLASRHPEAGVRSLAVWCLMAQSPEFAKPYFFNAVADTTLLVLSGGCIPIREPMGDFLIAKAEEYHLLDSCSRATLDSILIHNPDAWLLARRQRLIRQLPLTPAHAELVRSHAARHLDGAAIEWLCRYQEEEDTLAVIRAMERTLIPVRRAGRRTIWYWAYNEGPLLADLPRLIAQWRHPAFRRTLESIRDTIVTHLGYFHDEFAEITLLYDTVWSGPFIEETFALLAGHPDNQQTPTGSLTSRLMHQFDTALEKRWCYKNGEMCVDPESLHIPCILLRMKEENDPD